MNIAYDKLVRDKIPEIIEAAGKKITRKANDAEYLTPQKSFGRSGRVFEKRRVRRLADILGIDCLGQCQE